MLLLLLQLSRQLGDLRVLLLIEISAVCSNETPALLYILPNLLEFTLKHLDETKTVGRDEVISLAQRGLDYDRVKEKLTAANAQLAALQGADERLEFFKTLADSQGKTLDQFIEATAAAVRAEEKQIPYVY